jgi:hypothetical protein
VRSALRWRPVRFLIPLIAVLGATLAFGVSTPRAASTLLVGDQSVEASQDSNAAGSAEAFPYTAVATGTATALSIYIDAANTASQVVVGVYTNSSSGDPGTLLAQATIASPTNGAWNSVTIPAVSITQGTHYWIAVLGPSGAGTVAFRDKASGGGSQSSSQSNLTTLPATWSSGISWSSSSMSAYLSDSTGSGTPTPTPTPTPTGDPSAVGQWSADMTWPIVAVHAAMLYTGQILIWDAWETPAIPRVWDPSTNTFVIASTGSNIFCAGQVQLADGRVLVIGGHNGGEYGIKDTVMFDPATKTFSQKANMAYARWYPAGTTLSDGRVLAFSGMISPTSWANTPEVYDPKNNTWTKIGVSTSDIKEEEYPTTYLLPNGKVFAIGPESNAMRLLDMANATYGKVGAGTLPTRYGSVAMYRPGQVLYTGGGANYGDNSVTMASTIDLNQPSPAWQPAAPMAYGRYMHTLVMLPDGTVMAVGGASTVSQETATPGPLHPEIWNPDTNTWTTMAAEHDPRMYHSTALLMPDGRVLAAGGGRWSTSIDYFTAEIFSPPYLFKGARPTIAGAPSSATYGDAITVQSPDAASIAKVSLVNLGADTHTSDMSQRFVPLSFTASGTSLTVQMPANGNIAPPGYYMLFLVNGNGVPSVAQIIQVGGASQTDTQAPTVSLTAPAAGATVAGTVTVAATASDNVGVTSVQVTLDGAPLGAPVTTAPYTYNWDTTTATTGSHTLSAQARDAAGNVGTAPPVPVTVSNADSTPPVITAVAAGSLSTTSATITWTTDEPATSQVNYGTTTSYGASTTRDATLTTSHSQPITGLTPGTTYHYQVLSTDAAGNSAYSADATFTTPTATTGPVISGVQAGTISAAEATITWTTDTAATSQVEYGKTTAYGSTTPLSTSLVTSHTVKLTKLAAGTLYHYRVKSKDAAGTLAVSADATFTTQPVLVGSAVIQGTVDANVAGQAEAFQSTAAISGSVTQLYVYVDGGSTATQVVVGLYTNTASGNPGTLLTQGTVASPTKGAWNSVRVPAVSVTAGTRYWLAVLAPVGAGTLKFRDVGSGGPTQNSSQTTLTTLPATWSPGPLWANSPASLYAAPGP